MYVRVSVYYIIGFLHQRLGHFEDLGNMRGSFKGLHWHAGRRIKFARRKLEMSLYSSNFPHNSNAEELFQ